MLRKLVLVAAGDKYNIPNGNWFAKTVAAKYNKLQFVAAFNNIQAQVYDKLKRVVLSQTNSFRV